jgi:predicted metal-dependent enzyme (double-stranded beta helix superfamily)
MGGLAMLDKEDFLEDCRAAIKGKDAQAVIRELIARAVSEPSQLMHTIGEPKRAGIETIYKADDLTILNICWGPRMEFKPHDHRIWAVIGIYTGREQNTFFRRADRGLAQHGTKELSAKDVAPLGAAIIHAVTNPLEQITGAIHVYGGDFFETPRSEWDPKTLHEQPFSMEHTKWAFEEANARLGVESRQA